MSETGIEQGGMNRECIKYIAMATMFCNHFAHVFLSSFTPLWELFINSGYFTAPVMCYFLVEGFAYTHSRAKYALRLFMFAVISQIPYRFALGLSNWNMLFSLFLCFCILMVMDGVKLIVVRVILVIFLMWLSTFTDWALFAPMFTVLFASCKSHKYKLGFSFGSMAVVFAFSYYPLYSRIWEQTGWLHTAYVGTGIIVAGIVILCFYNGQRATWGQPFSKWFFYMFYPGHLVLLGLMRMWING